MMGFCSISFNCQMLANFSGVEFEKTVPKIKKKKKKNEIGFSCSRPS